MNVRSNLAPCLVLCVLALQAGFAQADRLFESVEPLDIEITGPLRQVRSERDKSQSYKATLVADENRFDIELRVRGNKRLDPKTCSYPPLWVDFEPDAIRKTLFAHQKNLKLVVLCKDNQRYRNYLRAEFLIYRMFNLLTPLSYRVRWVNVTYLDEKGDSRFEPAFFIERRARMANRNVLETSNVSSIRPSELEPESSAMVGLFQFIISNADYSVVSSADDSCCHNAKLLVDDSSRYRPVIYDFDSSGLVNARYAVPNPVLKIKKVTRRLYRGYCLHNDLLEPARDRILSLQPEFLELLDDAEIEERARGKMIDFLTESLEMIDDEEVWQEQILGGCWS